MTNEEKAREIANEYCYWDDRDESGAVKVAIEMAEWKDSEFDAKLNYFYNLIHDGIPFEKAYFCVTGKNWQR